MKVPCILFASVVAASTVTFYSIENNRDISYICTNEVFPSSTLVKKSCSGNARKSNEASVKEEKFVPKFDGLRFIETLVTAHR